MKNEETKRATLEALDAMIENSEQGASGFWVEDGKGCGNPKIFPEFAEGIKRGRLVQMQHYLCPWNTAVLYGKGYGNINNGCYHSCSIEKARFLSANMLKDVLGRFKTRLINGLYDCKDDISPLLTTEEISYIEKELKKEELLEEKRHEEECNNRLKKAAALAKKYPEEKDLFALHYGENVKVQTYDGIIDFSPDGYRDIKGAENFTYNDYIDVQIRSFNKTRTWFAKCYYNIPLGFMGCIEKTAKDKICFNRIAVDGMYSDGSCFVGREEHVWMDISGFEKYKIADCLSFSAEVYRYVKKGNGKQIDFALRNPEDIEKIEQYELPSDNELSEQAISQIICETCHLNEKCSGGYCLLPDEFINEKKKQMMDFLKTSDI